jgi:hypothetical protein
MNRFEALLRVFGYPTMGGLGMRIYRVNELCCSLKKATRLFESPFIFSAMRSLLKQPLTQGGLGTHSHAVILIISDWV